jgi:indolepyruvate ferredoxin oxidoreductase, alpha subunit
VADLEELSSLNTGSDAAGARLFMLGNEAIARGALEAGVQVTAAYPGTPSTEITETLLGYAEKRNMYVEWSVNEKVAFEIALAASICGARALAVMKHVGVNVAHDAVAMASYIGAKGGLVLISADDPGQWSSQSEQDNRFIAEQSYIPVLEPSSPQEAKDMTAEAFRLSEEFHQPFMLRSVTRIGHARGDVTLGTLPQTRRPGVFEKNIEKLVSTPANFRRNRKLMVERMDKIREAVNSLPYNQLHLKPGAKLGIIACGITNSYVMEALRWLNLEDRTSLLKIGITYPLPEKLILNLLGSVPEVLVIEELEPLVEEHVRAAAQRAGLSLRIYGKDTVPLIGELSTRKVVEAVAQVSGVKAPIDFAQIDRLVKEVEPLLPLRPPTMCAGCPHRATAYAINAACDRIKLQTGIEPVRPGDIGCNALASGAPFFADDVSTCMGSGFELANGLARVLKAPIIGHMGDSTFFHSGIPPMINAVFNQARITMVVMDNSTTAMTGYQPHPGTGHSDGSKRSPPIRPEDIARASGVQFVEVVDPLDLPRAIDAFERAILFQGPSLVVSRSSCSILEQREKRSRGEEIIPYYIQEDKCLAGEMPACTAACPLHVDVRGYLKLIGAGKYAEALKLIREKLPFPAILGRICSHPCESQCLRRQVDDSLAIAALKRSAAEFGKVAQEDLSIEKERPQKVAIVGGGPAGVMAAYDLRKNGYQVTVFEASSELGGMLAAGIPEHRLPREIMREEIAIIRRLGVEVRLNTRVGLDLSFLDLKKNFDAVFIAAGAQNHVTLNVEGEKLGGVYSGLSFLKKFNAGEELRIGNKAAVIGGGNVAVDAALSLLRLGVASVSLVCLESRQDMPAYAEEIVQAEEEGVRMLFSWGVKKIAGTAGKVAGLDLKACTGIYDEGGRFSPSYDEKVTRSLEADAVIIAIGQTPELSFLDNSGVGAAGVIQADPLTLCTKVPGVFAGGDIVSGPSTVIEALAAGRKAAVSIDRYLKGEALGSAREAEGVRESRLKVETAGIPPQPRLKSAKLPVALRRNNFREVDSGFSREDAAKEASRCLSCDCNMCIKALGCPAIVLQDEQVLIDSSQCPGCGLCAQICPAEAIIKK